MRINEFLDLIERWGVMPELQVDNLREQVAESDYPVHPVQMARRLVEEGYINSYFAKTLLAGGPPGGLETNGAEESPAAAGSSGSVPLKMQLEDAYDEGDVADLAAIDELALAPIEGADWLTRSADLEVGGSLPTLGTTLSVPQENTQSVGGWLQQTGPGGLPWWVVSVAAVAGLIFVIAMVAILI